MADEEKVELKIDRKTWSAFSDVELKRAVDVYSSASFSSPFEAERQEMRETFRPFTYKPVELAVNGEKIFGGRMVGVHPVVTPDSRSVDVTAYAYPGTLSDCTAAAAALPLEYKGLKLQAIAAQLCAPFGINVSFPDGDGPPFDKVALDSERKIQDFLVELAQLRNLVITDTVDGDLLCWRTVTTGKPVARLKDTEQPVTSVESDFNSQDYYSEITGLSAAKRKRTGSSYTALNPWLRDVHRPMTFKLDSAEKQEAPEATKAHLGRMFANAAPFAVNVATWRDPSGNLWRPNTTIVLHAPDSMIYTPTEFIIREVVLKQTKDENTAVLGLVLQGAFDGAAPASLPWNES